jgi:hypothetical protein
VIDSLDRRLASLLLLDREITADDITDRGRLSFDPEHSANGRQSAIGSRFRRWAADGLIEPTGRVVRSQAPHRKGGAIRVWTGTDKGRAWADDLAAGRR